MQVTVATATLLSLLCSPGQNTGLIWGGGGHTAFLQLACLVSASSVVRCLGTAGGVTRGYREWGKSDHKGHHTDGTCSTCQQRLPGTAVVGRPLAPGLCCLLWHGLPQGLIRPSVVHALQLRPGGTAGAYKAGFEGATQDCHLGTGGPTPSCLAQAVCGLALTFRSTLLRTGAECGIIWCL